MGNSEPLENSALNEGKAVWIINHYAQDPSQAGGTRHYNLASRLQELGWHCTVLASSVTMHGDTQRIKKFQLYRDELIGGIKFRWVWTPTYRGNGVGRVLNILVYGLSLLIPNTTKALRRPAVIIGSTVHPLAALSAFILSRRVGVPFIFEVRDLWPQTLIDMKKIRSTSIVARALRLLEHFLYKRAEKIVVLLPNAAEYIALCGDYREKVVWISNGTNIADYPYYEIEPAKQTFDFMYIGSHGVANGLHTLIAAMREIHNSGNAAVRLTLVGDGPSKPELQSLVREWRLENTFFHDPIPKSEVPSLAQKADAFVLTVRDLPDLYRYGISMNKIFDYLAMARPIVIAMGDTANDPVTDAKAGLKVPPDDAVALASAMLALVEMPHEERIAMGQRGRGFAEQNFSYDVLGGQLAQVLNEIADENRVG